MLSMAVALMIQTSTQAEAVRTSLVAIQCLVRETHRAYPGDTDEGFARARDHIERVSDRCSSEIETAAEAAFRDIGGSTSDAWLERLKVRAVEAYHRTYLAPAGR